MPEVSVIMGVLQKNEDNKHLLIRSVNSILTQTFTDFEFLICDDGSCNEIVEVLDAFSYRDSRIKILRFGNRFTLPQKLNHCLGYAEGQYIARMDDDDYSIPQRFEEQISFLKLNPCVSFVGCNVKLVRNIKVFGYREMPKQPEKEDFLIVQPFIHPTLMFQKSAIYEIGGYSESKYQELCEDYDLLLRLYEKGHIGYNLQDHLLEYNLPPREKSRRKFKHRLNEVVTRWQRFNSLGLLPMALPFVIKPFVVGMMPLALLDDLKWGRLGQYRKNSIK